MTPPAPPDGPEMHLLDPTEHPDPELNTGWPCTCGFRAKTFQAYQLHLIESLKTSLSASLGREQALTAERDVLAAEVRSVVGDDILKHILSRAASQKATT